MDDLGVPPFQETSICIHLNDTLCSVDILFYPYLLPLWFGFSSPFQVKSRVFKVSSPTFFLVLGLTTLFGTCKFSCEIATRNVEISFPSVSCLLTMKIPKTLVPSPDGLAETSLQDTEASSCSEADPTAACECGGCQDAPGESVAQWPVQYLNWRHLPHIGSMHGLCMGEIYLQFIWLYVQNHRFCWLKLPSMLVQTTIYVGLNPHLSFLKKKNKVRWLKNKTQSVGQNVKIIVC